MTTHEISAVFWRDFDNYIDKLGYKDMLSTDKVRCFFCEQIINKKNLFAIFPYNDSINFTCANPKCTTQLSELRDLCGL